MHLQFCTNLYAIQIQQGRHFLREYLQGASSWREGCIQRMLGTKGVVRVDADQCQYGMISKDKFGTGLARKATGFMTIAPCIAVQVQRNCPNRPGRMHHGHITLQSGRAKAAQIDPDELCRAICRGLMDQIEVDRKDQLLLAHVHGTEREARDVQEQYKTVEDETEALDSAFSSTRNFFGSMMLTLAFCVIIME